MPYTKKVEPLLRPGKGRFPGHFAYAQSRSEIAKYRHIEQEGFLKNDGHSAAQLETIVRAGGNAVKFDGSGGGLMEQGQSEKEGCFSCPVRTYERDGLTLIQGEIIDAENHPGGIYPPKISGNQHWFQNGTAAFRIASG
jgi:hypothetical protein